MFRFASGESERRRGQIGIETLVVFIAMSLVAALAASMLVQTAGVLQNEAGATSEDSQAQVSNQVYVVGAVGTVNATAGEENVVTSIELSVMQSPGSSEIDLSGATIQYVGPDGVTTLAYEDAGVTGSDDVADGASATAETFGVTAVKDVDDSVPVLNSRADRFSVEIELDANATNALVPLAPGEEATVELVTLSGARTTVVVNVPLSLSSADDGEAVAL